MTGVIINNNFYDISTGNTKIEYNSMGNGTLSYSMYGENIPEVPEDKLLEWINIPTNTFPYYGGDGCIYSKLDYRYNTENYLEFYCCPIVGYNYVEAYKDFMVFCNSKSDSSSDLYGGAIWLDLNRTGSTLGKNRLQYWTAKSSDDIYSNYYNVNANTIAYGKWYKIGSYKKYLVINEITHIGKTSGTYKPVEGDKVLLFNRLESGSQEGFEGKFSYFNVYSDMTKTALLHSYRPFLTPENEIVIKDIITGNAFPLVSNGGTLDNITYEIAQN